MRAQRRTLAPCLFALLALSCADLGGPLEPIGPPAFTRVTPEMAEVGLFTGQSVAFEVEASSPAGRPLLYEYRVDGEIVAASAAYLFAPSDTGRYRVEAVVSDGERSASRAWSVTVAPPPNAPPIAVLALDPATGPAPLAVRARLTGADPDGLITRYRVEVAGAAAITLERAAPIDTVFLLGEGAYTVAATVEDDRGARATANDSVRVYPPPPNAVPIVSLTTHPSSGDAPLAVTARFVGRDPDGTVASVAIDFDGDGRPEAAVERAELDASHTYTVEGTFTVRATAVDDKGATAAATTIVVVRPPNAPPTGSLTASETTGDAPVAVTLQASGSDADGRVIRWEIDPDDGSGFAEVAASPSRSVTYPFRPSVYRPRLRLTDDRGAQSVIQGPSIMVHRPVSASRSSASAIGNPRFDGLSIAPAIWAEGSDRLRFTILVRDHAGEPLAGVPVRVTSLRPDLVVQGGTNLGGTVTVGLDATTTDEWGGVTGWLTTRTSSRAYRVPTVGAFQSFALAVEADAGHGKWRRLPDITGLNAEAVVNGSEGVGQFSVIPSGLVCVGTPLEIRVGAVRRSDAPGAGGPANGLVTEIRYYVDGMPLPGLRPASGYESWRTDGAGRIVFRFTPTRSDFRAIVAWVDGQPLNIATGLAVQDC